MQSTPFPRRVVDHGSLSEPAVTPDEPKADVGSARARRSTTPRRASSAEHLQRKLLNAFEFEDSHARARRAFSDAIAGRLTSAGHSVSAAEIEPLVQDADGNGRFGIDVHALQRLVEGTPQNLATALVEKGGDGIVAPPALGTEGRTPVQRLQQQLAARGGLFVDADENGAIDDSDAVYFLDAKGNRLQTTYGALSPDLKGLLRGNQRRVDLLEAYAVRPPEARIGWAHPENATANARYWKADSAGAWTLKPGQRPSEAVQDILHNSKRYSTECAQGRTALQLVAHLNHLEAEHGLEDGRQKFDDMFADEPGHTLRIKGHLVEGPGGTNLGFQNAIPGREPGSNGYFHTIGASVEGVAKGYVGENVIDLGLLDGERRFFGHPGLIRTETEWQSELAHQAAARTPPDLGASFPDAPAVRAQFKFGPLSSRARFDAYLGTDTFDVNYSVVHGRSYEGPTNLEALSLEEVRALVETISPKTASRLTPYGQVYQGTDDPEFSANVHPVSWQAAHLLKTGRVPDAHYGTDPTSD